MNYLIIYNHTQIIFDPNDIHRTITTLEGNIDWWHYLPSVYIVDTIKDEKFIADKIIAKHPGLLFLVVNVNLNRNNGVLNKNAWEWINKKTKNLLRVKPAPQPPRDVFFDLFGPKIMPSASSKTSSSILDDFLSGKIK